MCLNIAIMGEILLSELCQLLLLSYPFPGCQEDQLLSIASNINSNVNELTLIYKNELTCAKV